MNDKTDEVLDALLREQFDGPVPDGGFCDSVMTRLPARRRRSLWPLVAGAFAGVAACGFSLRSSPIAIDGLRDWLSGDISASALTLLGAMVCMAILAAAWTIAEANEQNGTALVRRPSIRIG